MDPCSMTVFFADRAFARVFQTGLRSIVLCRSEVPRPIVRREVGSLATDRIARYRDMDVFGTDVRRGQRDVTRR
jgi:hypothetical protein